MITTPFLFDFVRRAMRETSAGGKVSEPLVYSTSAVVFVIVISVLLFAAKAQEYQATFEPKIIQVDFEASMIRAVTASFPATTSVRGCVFHYGNALWKNLSDKGCIPAFKNNATFVKCFNRIKVSKSTP